MLRGTTSIHRLLDALRLTCSSACALTGAPVTVYLPWLSSSVFPGDFSGPSLRMLPPSASFSIRSEFAYYSWMAGIIRRRVRCVKNQVQ